MPHAKAQGANKNKHGILSNMKSHFHWKLSEIIFLLFLFLSNATAQTLENQDSEPGLLSIVGSKLESGFAHLEKAKEKKPEPQTNVKSSHGMKPLICADIRKYATTVFLKPTPI